MRLLISTLVLLTTLGCATRTDSVISRKFNERDFTGLVSLGDSYKNIKLDYELDDLNKKSMKFTTCQQVDMQGKEKILVSQYRLFVLLQINCAAANYYFSGKPATITHFPEKLSLGLVRLFPAESAPHTGREDMTMRKNMRLEEHEKNLKLKFSDNGAVTVTATEDEEITYIVMARADVNNDSIEDIVVRLDWSIPNSFGQGFDLLVLSKTSAAAPIKLLWRYTK